ncbi:MAG TPA: hypothetical protein VJH21_01510 [Candidatus Paceibacterota bacterium]
MSKKPVNEVEERASADWYAIMLLFGFSRYKPEVVLKELNSKSEPFCRCFQLALKGTGHVTKQFIPDGKVGDETAKSILQLYAAAGKLTKKK